ncbi:hypothetical protein L7F22_013664 [Adiantum nelumboides]|nr:hypothetical protein [Adiantum nelumboides]
MVLMGKCGRRSYCMMFMQAVVLAVLLVVVASTTASGRASTELAAAGKRQQMQIYLVGGEEEGWTLPPGSSGQLSYASWVQQRAFHVGDILVFQYQPNLHNVLQVDKDDYANCNTSNPLARYSNKNTTITLDKSGEWYFICGILSHCALGQKLEVTCLDNIPNKQLPSISSPKPPNSIPSPPFISFPSFPSMPPTPVFDSPSPFNADNPTPSISNDPFSTPNLPFINSPPPTIDPSSPSSCPNNVPPPFSSPPISSTPCVCQILPPPPPPQPPYTSPSLPSSNLSPPSPSNLSPLAPSTNFSPSLQPNPPVCVAIVINVYLLFFGALPTILVRQEL